MVFFQKSLQRLLVETQAVETKPEAISNNLQVRDCHAANERRLAMTLVAQCPASQVQKDSFEIWFADLYGADLDSALIGFGNDDCQNLLG